MALKRYRLRIFDGQYEVLHRAKFYIDVDLDSSTRNAILDRQLVALVERARVAENEPMDHPIMKVYDRETGAFVLDVVA